MTNMLPKNFDWQFYLENNPDLKDAGLSTQTDAENHWLNHGHQENRKYARPISTRLDTHVVNCYHKNSSSGIGDFLRGSIYLHEHYSNFDISLDNHPISKYLFSKSKNKIALEDIIDIYQATVDAHGEEYILPQLERILSSSIEDNKYVCSMYSDLLYGSDIHLQLQNHELSDETRTWFQNNLIFSKSIKKTYRLLDLFKYDVSHVRLGDFKLLQDQLNIQDTNILGQINYQDYNPKISTIIFDILKTQSQNNRPMVIMSDNDDFKQALMDTATKLNLEENFKIIHTDSNHCSTQPGLLTHTEHRNNITDQQLFNVVLDLYTMSKSKNIYSYSVYPWGSGFSYAIAKIYDIPLTISIL